jgi:hypothetical protein
LSRCLREVGAQDGQDRLARRYEEFRNIRRAGVDFVDEGDRDKAEGWLTAQAPPA